MQTDDIVHIGVQFTLDITALILNMILIAAIITRTPSYLRSFSFFLLNTSIVDSATAFISSMSAVRFINMDGRIVYLFVGPCTLFGVKTCHAVFTANIALICHAEVLLLISFSYRVWVLSKHDQRPNIARSNLIKIILAATLPSWIPMFGLYRMCSFDAELPAFENHTYCVNDIRARRLLSTENLASRGTIAYLMLFFTSILLGMAALRRVLIAKIFALEFALGSPLITLAILGPYRRLVHQLLCCSRQDVVHKLSEDRGDSKKTGVATTNA